MDPANVIGIIGVIGQIIKTTYEYGDGVLECKTEVARLRAELFGMQAALNQIERDLSSTSENDLGPLASTNLKSQESCQVLEEARALLEPLAESLKEGISRTDRLTKRLAWPFKRQHVQDIASHLERFKTYFILAATTDTLQATRDTAESLRRLHVSIESLKVSERQKYLESEAYRWLDTYDSSPAHNAALSAHMEGTNTWFLDGVLSDFFLGEMRVLWLTGRSGSGKTCMMAASVSRMMKESQSRPVAYFYCSSNHSVSQEPRTILASLVGQLFRQDETARHHIINVYHRSRAPGSNRSASLDISALIILVQQICSEISDTVVFFVDAVDECATESRNTVQMLVQVASQIGNARLVISSTEDISSFIRSDFFSSSIELEEVGIRWEDVMTDINAYVEKRFKEETRLSKLRPQMQIQIKKELCATHHGSFRWVQCTIDDLVRLATPRAMKEALRGVTPSLSETYTAILDSIPADMAKIAHSMLLYLLPAKYMGLTLEELAEVAAFSSVDNFCEDDRLIEPEAVIYYLRNLVRYDPITSCVELAHSSVGDFLTSPERSGEYYIDPTVETMALFRASLKYLTNPAFRQFCPNDQALKQRKEDWPFFSYASRVWTQYVRRFRVLPDDIKLLLSKLIDSADLPHGGNWASWYQCVFPRGDPDVWKTRPLYICARAGLIHPLQNILDNCDKWELEQRGGQHGSTPLHVAAYFGQLEAVKLLLAAGANPNERNDLGENGLEWAASKRYHDIVEVLLESGADPELAKRPRISEDFLDRMVVRI